MSSPPAADFRGNPDGLGPPDRFHLDLFQEETTQSTLTKTVLTTKPPPNSCLPHPCPPSRLPTALLPSFLGNGAPHGVVGVVIIFASVGAAQALHGTLHAVLSVLNHRFKVRMTPSDMAQTAEKVQLKARLVLASWLVGRGTESSPEDQD